MGTLGGGGVCGVGDGLWVAFASSLGEFSFFSQHHPARLGDCGFGDT